MRVHEAEDADPGAGGDAQGRTALADRFALLIDGAEYFRRLRQALLAARRDVFLVGWDFDMHIELVRDTEPDDDAPTRLGELLNHITSRRPLRKPRRIFAPRVHVLAWDFSTYLALDRRPLTILRRKLELHARIRQAFDAKHPLGASHHQKIVVIDDAVAFVGSTDLTSGRWDLAAHEVDDPARVDPKDKHYPPHHEVQAIVSGAAARALGDVARERWKRVSKHRLRPPKRDFSVHAWPPDLEPDLANVALTIVRTRPEFGGEEALREVEASYLESIARAERSIYLETQYLTSRTITSALTMRLAEPEGPEVVLVQPSEASGWFEQLAIGDLVQVAHAQLRAGDKHGRLRILRPVASRANEVAVYVHAKLAIFDDRQARVGSANLSARSMGLDTECDVVAEVRDSAGEERVRALRERLLAHWLGETPEAFRERMRDGGSLCAVLDAARAENRDRGLDVLDLGDPGPDKASDLADLDEPIEPTLVIDKFLPELVESGGIRGFGPAPMLVTAVLATTIIALVWRFTALAEMWPVEALDRLDARLQAAPASPFIVLSIYVFATLPLVPVHLVVLATVLVLGGMSGGAYAMLGLLVGASAHFGLGRFVGGRRWVQLLGARFERFAAKIQAGDLASVIALRLLPVAPFFIVNLACSVSRVRFPRFLAGTFVGSLPSVLAIALFGAQVRAVLREPGGTSVVWLVVIAGGFLAFLLAVRSFLVDHLLYTFSGSAGRRRPPDPSART